MTKRSPSVTLIVMMTSFLSAEYFLVISPSTSVSTKNSTGIENLAESRIRLLNNPVNEQLNIQFDESGTYQLRIFNLTGTLLSQENIKVADQQTQHYNVSNINNGMYILNIKGNNKNYTVRFIKLSK